MARSQQARRIASGSWCAAAKRRPSPARSTWPTRWSARSAAGADRCDPSGHARPSRPCGSSVNDELGELRGRTGRPQSSVLAPNGRLVVVSLPLAGGSHRQGFPDATRAAARPRVRVICPQTAPGGPAPELHPAVHRRQCAYAKRSRNRRQSRGPGRPSFGPRSAPRRRAGAAPQNRTKLDRTVRGSEGMKLVSGLSSRGGSAAFASSTSAAFGCLSVLVLGVYAFKAHAGGESSRIGDVDSQIVDQQHRIRLLERRTRPPGTARAARTVIDPGIWGWRRSRPSTRPAPSSPDGDRAPAQPRLDTVSSRRGQRGWRQGQGREGCKFKRDLGAAGGSSTR